MKVFTEEVERAIFSGLYPGSLRVSSDFQVAETLRYALMLEYDVSDEVSELNDRFLRSGSPAPVMSTLDQSIEFYRKCGEVYLNTFFESLELIKNNIGDCE